MGQLQAVAGATDKSSQSFAQAIEAARQIEDASWRAMALVEIAKAQAEAGQCAPALEITRQIEDASQRARALREIVKTQAKAGQIDQAIQTAEQITGAPEVYTETLLEIARVLLGLPREWVGWMKP